MHGSMLFPIQIALTATPTVKDCFSLCSHFTMAPKKAAQGGKAAAAGAKKPVKSMKNKKVADDSHDSVGPMGYLKYLQHAKKATDEQKERATEAVTLYKGLDSNNKNQFLVKFKEAKDDKSLSWVKDFSESLTKKQETKKKEHANHMTRHLLCTCIS